MINENQRIAQLEQILDKLIYRVEEIERALYREDTERQEAKTVDEWFDSVKKRFRSS